MTSQNPPQGLTPQEARLQRILKIVVLVLGIAILVVLGVIVSKIVGGSGGDDLAEAPLPVVTTEDAEGRPIAAAPGVSSLINQDLHLPKGATVVDMTLGGGLLAVRYRLPSGAEEIALLDMGDGALRGRVRVISAE